MAVRIERLDNGTRMLFYKATPESLVKAIIENSGRKVGHIEVNFGVVNNASNEIAARCLTEVGRIYEVRVKSNQFNLKKLTERKESQSNWAFNRNKIRYRPA